MAPLQTSVKGKVKYRVEMGLFPIPFAVFAFLSVLALLNVFILEHHDTVHNTDKWSGDVKIVITYKILLC